MEYGNNYLTPSAKADDDAVSMLSAHAHPSRYSSYQQAHSRDSSEESLPSRTSLAISPLPSQQPSLRGIPLSPLLSPQQETPHGVEASLFESRAVLNRPYRETVAYENATTFGPAAEYGPKPDYEQFNMPGRDPPGYGSQRYFRPPRRVLEPWNPGWWARFPWLGMGALLIVVVLTGVTVGLLLASNRSAISQWQGGSKLQPQVYVSIFSTIMDALLAFALADGLVIYFWRQAINGTLLGTMHDTYQSSFLRGAVSRICRLQFNTVAVACILVAISALRGPLFQRVSTVSEHAVYNTSGDMNISIATTPAIEFFESPNSNPQLGGVFTPQVFDTIKNLSAGIPFSYSSPNCGDYCTTSIKGFGFRPNCTTTTQSFDLISLPSSCNSCNDQSCRKQCANLAQTIYNYDFFSVSWSTNAFSGAKSQDQALTLTTVFKPDSSCAGDIQIHTCALYQGTVEYDVVIANDSITTSGNASDYWDDSTTIDSKFMQEIWPSLFRTLFPPIAVNISATSNMQNFSYTTCIPAASDFAIPDRSNTSACSIAPQPLSLNDLSALYASQAPNITAPANPTTLCNLTWRDPMPDILSTMQSFALRLSLAAAASTTNASQKVPYTAHHYRNTYHTNGSVLAIATLVSLLGVLAVVPLYVGWWELGRTMTLSPVEVARAFGGNVLEGVDGNASAERVAAERGGQAVRYGVVERYGEEKRLRVAERGAVREVRRGEVFG